VDAADISTPLSASARYALPRHNCNALPHGTASFEQLAGSASST
jgi:hypothetical protein